MRKCLVYFPITATDEKYFKDKLLSKPNIFRGQNVSLFFLKKNSGKTLKQIQGKPLALSYFLYLDLQSDILVLKRILKNLLTEFLVANHKKHLTYFLA